MKTKEKNAIAVKNTKVEIVREVGSIDSMLTQTRSGLLVLFTALVLKKNSVFMLMV